MKRDLELIAVSGANFLRETLTSRLFYFFAVFSLLMAYFSYVMGIMAVDEERRIFMDFGLAAGELAVFSFMLFISSLAVNREMETKTVYLVLARPLPRSIYVYGKLFGLILSCAFLTFGVYAVHLSVMLLNGYRPDSLYFMSVFSTFLKVSLASAFALAASLATTSSFSGMLISLMAWIFGHFSWEIKYMAEKAPKIQKAIILMFMNAMPNFQILNFRDFANIGNSSQGLLYFVCYFCFLSVVSAFIFSRKEF